MDPNSPRAREKASAVPVSSGGSKGGSSTCTHVQQQAILRQHPCGAGNPECMLAEAHALHVPAAWLTAPPSQSCCHAQRQQTSVNVFQGEAPSVQAASSISACISCSDERGQAWGQRLKFSQRHGR